MKIKLMKEKTKIGKKLKKDPLIIANIYYLN
jgi:hypothetical protein